jgi:hypothetical protein
MYYWWARGLRIGVSEVTRNTKAAFGADRDEVIRDIQTLFGCAEIQGAGRKGQRNNSCKARPSHDRLLSWLLPKVNAIVMPFLAF